MRKPSLLFIVILVFLILFIAAFLNPFGHGYSKVKARIFASRVDILSISTALDTYKKLHNDTYPTTEQGLKALIEKPTIPPIPKDWKGPYLLRKLIDPWGNPYQYCCPSKHNRSDFDLWSFGPDGKDETEDNMTNWAPFPEIHNDSILLNYIIIIVVIAIILFTYLLFPWKKDSNNPPL